MALDSNGIPVPVGQSATSFYNANRDAPTDPTVPAMIEDTRGLVETFLNLNQGFATDAVTAAQTTIDQLKSIKFPEALPAPPAAPSLSTTIDVMASINFDATPTLGNLTSEEVTPFAVDAVTIPDIEDELPIYTPLITSVSIPDAPTLVLPDEPVAPGVDTTLALPDAPAKDYGAAPDLVEIVLPTFVAPVIPLFGEAAPTFDTLPPDPFIQWREPVYASTIRDAVADVLQTMLAGGTGLPEDVERAIWERARVREDTAARKAIDEAINQWAAKGFAFPTGVQNAIAIAAQEAAAQRGNELSREQAIKAADMEQENRRFAVQQALDYERIFTGVFLAIVERNFEIAKFGVETQIQVYNLAVTAFNVQRQVWQSKIEKYRVDLDAAFAQLKGYEAQVEAARVAGEVNKNLVEVYDAKVRAYNSQVQAYEALVRGVTAQAQLQQNKVEIYKTQVDAMVGKINAQRAKFEAYDSQMKGLTSVVGLEEANARVFGEKARAIGVKADIVIKRADAQLQANKQTLDWNIANMQRVTQRGEQELRLIQANLAAFQAVTSRASAKYEADKSARVAEIQLSIETARVAIAQYSALIEVWKERASEILAFAQIQERALEAAGQMATNLAAGAMAGTHVSAGLSAGTSASQSNSRSSSDSTSQSRSVNESDTYNVNHNYQHRV